jgi:quinol monooxygenase YgiN
MRISLSLTLVGACALLNLPLSAEEAPAGKPVVRIATFTVAGPDQQEQVLKVADGASKDYGKAKGCQWVKFWYNPSTGENGSVSLWDNQSDLEAFLKSDAYKAILEKVKPLSKGDFASKVHAVHEPRK